MADELAIVYKANGAKAARECLERIYRMIVSLPLIEPEQRIPALVQGLDGQGKTEAAERPEVQPAGVRVTSGDAAA